MRWHRFNLILNPATTIDDYFPVAVFAAQIFVVDLFETALPDHVARFQSLVLVARLLQLLGTNLANVAEHVGQHAVSRIAPLRLLLDAQLRILQLVRFHPGDVSGSHILFHQNRFKSRLRIDLLEAIAQDVGVNGERLGEWLNQRTQLASAQVFARKDNVKDWTGIREGGFAVVGQDITAGRGNWQQPDALVLSNLGVIRAADELQVIEPDSKQREHQHDEGLHHPKATAEVL